MTVAGVGAELTKKETPYLPVTPDEIIQEIIAVSQLGATIFHLHVRDDQGKPTCNLEIIRFLIQEVRKKTDIIFQVSTGGDVHDPLSERLKTLDAGAEMGSLTLGSVNFGKEIFYNSEPIIEQLALKMKRLNVKPELEIFDVAFMEYALILIEKGLVNPPYHFNIILGGHGWLSATVENLEFILKKLPKDSTWSASGVGKNQFPMIEYALAHEGHVRTGLEDNIFIKKKVLAKGNKELVEQVLMLAKKYKRSIATVKEARKILGIKQTTEDYYARHRSHS